MKIRFIDNQNEKLGWLLAEGFESSSDTRIAIAFASDTGLMILDEGINLALLAGGSIEILVGLDFSTTNPKALWTMYRWAQDFEMFNFYCLPPGRKGIYHPKMYLMMTDEYATIVVGSSNLTKAGLLRNAEANIVVNDRLDSEIVSDAFASYVRLKFDSRFVPDEEYLSLYEDTATKRGKAENIARKSVKLASFEKALSEKAALLAKPIATE